MFAGVMFKEAKLLGRNQCLTLEDAPDHLDLAAAELGDVGDGADIDLAVLAIAPADQLGRRRFAVGYPGDIHAYIITLLIYYYKYYIFIYMPIN